MESTRLSPCAVFPDASPKKYQDAAASALILEGREISPWAWITPTCGTVDCIEVEHLTVQSPVALEYPRLICVYCGRGAGTKDHLLPRRWCGDAKRQFVVTVPSCGTCNSALSDTLTWSITERRALVHERLRRKYKKVLRTPDRTPEELEEYGPMLRSHIENEAEKKAEVLRMLAWPGDVGYDERALVKSGLMDPYAIGLILPDDVDLDEWVRNVA